MTMSVDSSAFSGTSPTSPRENSSAAARGPVHALLRGECVLLIGGTGGIGSAIAEALLREGVAEVIAAVPASSKPRKVPAGVGSELVDVTDLESVRALAARLERRNVGVVINCAGVNGNCRLFSPGFERTAHREMDVNYYGLLNVAQVFGPGLKARRGGALAALLSFVSHVNLPAMATYSASKAAAHSLLQALRAELTGAGVLVCGIYPTAVDTSMSRDFAGPKLSPAELAGEVVRALKSGVEDVYPGPAATAYASLLADPKGIERAMAAG